MKYAFIAAAWLVAASASAQSKPVVTAPQPAQNRANAAVSGAPSVLLGGAAQFDLCTGVQSAAYGSPMLAVTLDVQHVDRACERIRKAKMLQQLGLGAAAAQVMCDDAEVRAAMLRAGTPCELQRERP